VPCARLGWPSRQLLSACRYTIYHIASYADYTVTIWCQVRGWTDTANFDKFPNDYDEPEVDRSGWDKDF